VTIRPSLAFSAMRAMEGRFSAEATHPRQTMEPVGPLSLARWHTRPIIGTDRPTKGFQTAPKPSWAQRSQHLGVGEELAPAGGVKLSEPEKCALGPGMHRADCGHHGGHSDGRLALRHDAS